MKANSIKKLRFQYNNFYLEYDKEYGCDKRTGWTIILDGSVIVELEQYLFVAIIKALNVYRQRIFINQETV